MIYNDGSEDKWKSENVWGIAQPWDPDGWNTFSADWTVPSDWDIGFPIEKFVVVFSPNRHDDTLLYYQLVDDFKFYVTSETDAPSVSPSLSLSPSETPTISPSNMPSRFPSSLPSTSPSDFPDYTSETIFKVLDEKEEYIYLKNIVSSVQVCFLFSLYTKRNV